MLEMEKNVIVEFLKSTDPEMDFDQSELTMSDCIELLMDKVEEMELDYSILSTAFAVGVNPNRFDEFHEAVMTQYETISEGDEIPESILDRIAAQFR
ncbi:MAG: hypothetical protein H7281_14200 [Bacteriovorax sp.]|nr:hypothetical protein [Bacteriovorax sp.]